ncbi:MAG: glycosyltransferase family 2 protein [Saprospiraceae bacterium]|nr:glycosyltransferase family 2 protein [Saprospiraceae bacterium]
MLFSIITIVYNGESLIEGTMQSVLNQTFTNYEYLIIDGQSKDKTFKIVENLQTKHPLSIKAISERDKGLYDAMNKGLGLARGEFIVFLNAGDRFFESTTLEKVAKCVTPDTDILFGETMLVNDGRQHMGTRTDLTVQKLPRQLTWRRLRYGMVVCHQSFFARRTLAESYMDNNLAADIDWVIRCLKKSKTTVHTQTIIAEYLMGGVSKIRHQQSLKDRYAVLSTHFGWLPNLFNHAVIVVRALIFKLKNKGKVSY